VAAVVEWWQRKRERIKEGEVVVAVKRRKSSKEKEVEEMNLLD
jgi:uncharacterized protein (DUF1919 family)